MKTDPLISSTFHPWSKDIYGLFVHNPKISTLNHILPIFEVSAKVREGLIGQLWIMFRCASFPCSWSSVYVRRKQRLTNTLAAGEPAASYRENRTEVSSDFCGEGRGVVQTIHSFRQRVDIFWWSVHLGQLGGAPGSIKGQNFVRFPE